MTEIVKSKKRRKKLGRLHTGCVLLLGAVIVVPVICYSSMWLFARFGGEWATSSDLPIPPNSQLLAVTYQDGFSYRIKKSLYRNQATSEELRGWFIQSGIPMSPFPSNIDGTSFIEYDDYYETGWLFHVSSMLQQLHSFAALMTQGWRDEMVPSCQNIRVYKDISLANNHIRDFNLAENTSVFAVATCWIAR